MSTVYWEWNPALNREVRVIKVRSAVNPKALGWDPPIWRRAVRWACDEWEKTGVVAFVPTFEPMSPGTYPAEAGIVQVTAQDPAEVSPGQSWWGYMNPHIHADQVVDSADVWINKICRQDWWQYVLAHEFGHILGLDHRTSGKTCMKPVTKAGPDADDLAAIREAYLAKAVSG